MKELELIRVSSGPLGTFGVLVDQEIPFALTCEDPWNDNLIGMSCIPEGSYICKRVNSPHFGNTFEVTNVPGRTHILFHRGNTIDDTKGCILVGRLFGEVNGKPAVLMSKEGFVQLISKLKSMDSFRLTVKQKQSGGAKDV